MRLSQPTKHDSQRRTSVLHVCLCWLLCLSVWRGPIPVVHEHALDVISLANDSQLAEHAIAYHPDCLGHERAGHRDSGLHFHFLMLDQSSNSLLADSNSVQNDVDVTDTLLKSEQQLHADLDINVAQLQIAVGDIPGLTDDLRFSSTANATFLQTQLYRTPALAVLCVCLC